MQEFIKIEIDLILKRFILFSIGTASDLFYPNSKTEVAIKTVNDPLDGKQRTALFCEMKILSNIDLHLNLINMLGSCTTEFVTTGEVFMLLEFCKKGKEIFKDHICYSIELYH